MNKVIATLLVILLVPMAAMAQNELIVTELMYNSIGTDVEWIELYNTTDADLDLTGWYILDDNAEHDPVYLSGMLGASEVLVLVGDIDLFSAQYPGVSNYLEGAYFQSSWALGNGGDGVQIYNAAHELISEMNYDDGGDWPGECDGDGPSLQLASIDCADFNDPACWVAGPDWGTPGIVEGTVATESTSFGGFKALFR